MLASCAEWREQFLYATRVYIWPHEHYQPNEGSSKKVRLFSVYATLMS
jgi:hypothetical protein